MAFGADFVMRLTDVRSRAASQPARPGEIRTLEAAAALAKPENSDSS
jgi:hypothetical protein